MSILIGKQAEKTAEEFLLNQGLTLIDRNYSCKLGEIDLIMGDQNDLVFVEVRYRKSQAFGGALESITYSKQKKIWLTAEHFLQTVSKKFDCDYRFDVIVFEENLEQMRWIKNAFSNLN